MISEVMAGYEVNLIEKVVTNFKSFSLEIFNKAVSKKISKQIRYEIDIEKQLYYWVICVARDEINGFDNQEFTVIDC